MVYEEQGVDKRMEGVTHSIMENRNPMQARGPVENARLLPQMLGMEWTSGGRFDQRSGLRQGPNSPLSCMEEDKQAKSALT